jgi:hypothetical protein
LPRCGEFGPWPGWLWNIEFRRAIADEDGPKVAKWFYEELLAHDVLDGDAVAYALDTAVRKLRDSGISLERWAPFIHMGV